MSELPECKCVSHTDDLQVHVLDKDHFEPLEEKAKLFNDYLSELVRKCPSNDDSISLQFYNNTKEMFEKFSTSNLIPQDFKLNCLREMSLFYLKFKDFDNHMKYQDLWITLLKKEHFNSTIGSQRFLEDIDDYIAFFTDEKMEASFDETKLENILDEVKTNNFNDLRLKAIIWIRLEKYKAALKICLEVLKNMPNLSMVGKYSAETEIRFFIAHCHSKLSSSEKLIYNLRSEILLERTELNEQDKYYKIMTHYEMGKSFSEVHDDEDIHLLEDALLHFCVIRSYFESRTSDKETSIENLLQWILCLDIRTPSIFGEVLEHLEDAKAKIEEICDVLPIAGIEVYSVYRRFYENAMDQSELLPIRYHCATAAIFLKSNLLEITKDVKDTVHEYNLYHVRAKIAKQRKMFLCEIEDYLYLYEYLSQLAMENLDDTHKKVVLQKLVETVSYIINIYRFQFMLDEKHEFLAKLKEQPLFLKEAGPEFLVTLMRDYLEQGNYAEVQNLSNRIRNVTSIDKHWKQLLMGLCYFKLGEFSKASKILKKICPIEDGEQGMAVFTLSTIYYTTKDFEKSLDCLKKCKKMFNKDYDQPDSHHIFVKVTVCLGAISMMKKLFRLMLETFSEIWEPRPNYELLLSSTSDRFGYGLFFCMDKRPLIFLDLTGKKNNWKNLSYHSNKQIKKQWRTFKNTYLINFVTQKKFL